ncbi:hypothetical protein I204_06245 [Kwoniella mangroviensis CBS 8886]|nr:uncharacterized protein I203_03467 [Kwoniella mangroviensis CBS 8507]OCF67769.1 hypothetical protein I203_03467 [Kwoniella mangroviensis CBS 8507]OCF73015.1 hypothetical protein I204_06245 [Kwoniella mangroviensis CBS 8886]
MRHSGNARSNKGPITSEKCWEIWYSAGKTIKESSESDRTDDDKDIIVLGESGKHPDIDMTLSDDEACQAALAHLKMFEWIERRAGSNLPVEEAMGGKENNTRMT